MYSLEKSFCSHDGRRLAVPAFLERDTAELPQIFATNKLMPPKAHAIFEQRHIVSLAPVRTNRSNYAFAVLGSVLVLFTSGAFLTMIEFGGVR